MLVRFANILFSLALAIFNLGICIFNLAFGASTWEGQMRRIEKRRLIDDGGLDFDLSSVPAVERTRNVANVFSDSVGAVDDPPTGVTLEDELAAEGGVPAELIVEQTDTAEARPTWTSNAACAACFICQIPEVRLLSFMIMAATACFDAESFIEYQGKVGAECQLRGPWYTALCGDPTNASVYAAEAAMSNFEWALAHPECLKPSSAFLDRVAALFESLAEHLGPTSGDGSEAKDLFNAWMLRDDDPRWRSRLPDEPFDDVYQRRHCVFLREACRLSRDKWPTGDPGPTYSLAEAETLPNAVGRFLFEACRESQHGGCVVALGKTLQVSSDDIATCLQSKPTCYKHRKLCFGQCSGNDAPLLQDFATGLSKRELGALALPTAAAVEAARSDCRMRTNTIAIPWFEGGAAFEMAAAPRARARASAPSTPRSAASSPARAPRCRSRSRRRRRSSTSPAVASCGATTSPRPRRRRRLRRPTAAATATASSRSAAAPTRLAAAVVRRARRRRVPAAAHLRLAAGAVARARRQRGARRLRVGQVGARHAPPRARLLRRHDALAAAAAARPRRREHARPRVRPERRRAGGGLLLHNGGEPVHDEATEAALSRAGALPTSPRS